MQRKIFVDEFIAKIQDDHPISYEQLKKAYKPSQPEIQVDQIAQSSKDAVGTNIANSTIKLDAPTVLGKLHSILKELLDSNVLCNMMLFYLNI